MKANSLLVIALILFSPSTVSAETTPPLKDLKIGETLTFQLAWNGIPVGSVTTTVEEITQIQKRKSYKVVARAETNRWASLFYKVDDTFVTYIDYETSTSLRYEAYRSEGKYRKKSVIDYIYGRFLAEYHYLKEDRKKDVDVSGDIHDPLSATYFFLRKEFEIGDQIILNIDLNEKRHRLLAKIEKGRRLRIPQIGRFDSIIVRPYLESKGKPYRRGNGWGYVSAGEDRLPLYAAVKVSIWGRFSAILSSRSPQTR